VTVEPVADPPTEPGSPVRLRLDLAYDGTAFSGWSRQPGLRTVQGELEAALATVFRHGDEAPPQLTVAGRTESPTAHREAETAKAHRG